MEVPSDKGPGAEPQYAVWWTKSSW